MLLQNFIRPASFASCCKVNSNHDNHLSLSVPSQHHFPILPPKGHASFCKILPCFATSRESDIKPDPQSSPRPSSEPRTRHQPLKSQIPDNGEDHSRKFPTTIPRKRRRGRRSEAVAVEDFVRNTLERTLTSIQQQSPEIFENKENIMKEKVDSKMNSNTGQDDDGDSGDDDEEEEGDVRKEKKMLVEEEDPSWPLDADVGWGIRASDYFAQHPIKNVVGEDGFEIDWEGEMDDSWVKEINCLEWETFAFHPSPLVVLVFERYNRASDNWRALKELEKAIKIYWSAKDRLPPRAIKIDINIERDLAYALKVRECPQILFLGRNKILYREKEMRTADELVNMIAHFYYNAKKPAWIK